VEEAGRLESSAFAALASSPVSRQLIRVFRLGERNRRDSGLDGALLFSNVRVRGKIGRGIALGTCDVTLLGPRDRKAILRILVRDVVARPAGEERLSIDERIAKGRTVMSSAETAQRSGYLYRASARYREALIILEPTKGARNAEADALRQQADRLGLAARKQLDGEFEKIKFQAVAKYLNRDLIGAAKAWEKLQNLIPDEEDEMSQKLRLIFDRTIYMLQRSNR
jgi:hypothetical protein